MVKTSQRIIKDRSVGERAEKNAAFTDTEQCLSKTNRLRQSTAIDQDDSRELQPRHSGSDKSINENRLTSLGPSQNRWLVRGQLIGKVLKSLMRFS